MTRRMRVIVLGGTGQIGAELCSTIRGFADVVSPTRAELDLTQAPEIEAFITTSRPDCVINAAAYTAVDLAESERQSAHTLNAALPGVLARATKKIGANLVHFSTDYVFAGTASVPYVETSETDPQNWYGHTKLEGETQVRQHTDLGVILRTSWVYGKAGNNFLRTMQRLARERDEISVVADQIGSPTWSRDVASATASIVLKLGRDQTAWREHSAIYHLTASGRTSWYEFALRIFQLDPARAEYRVQKLHPIETAQYVTPAKRPMFSVLDNSLVAERFGVRLPDWDVQLAGVLGL